MGREGEVIAQLLPEFERRNPDIRVQVQQLPWTAAHEKLLTAFAGDALPDLCQLGNTWVPEFAALARARTSIRFVASSRVVRRRTTFPASGTPISSPVDCTGSPGMSTRACCSIAATCSGRPASIRPPRSWEEWQRALAAVKREVGPARYAILLPLNEFEPLLALGLQQTEPLLRDDGRWGGFSSSGLSPRARLLCADVPPRLGAGHWATREISNVWTEFGRGYLLLLHLRPVEHRGVQAPPARERQGDWMTAPLPGPHGPGASTAGGSSLVIFRSSRHAQAAWRLIEFLSEPAVQVRFHQLTGNLPPRRTRVARRAARRRTLRESVPRPARARAARTASSRVGAHRQRDAAHRRAGRAAAAWTSSKRHAHSIGGSMRSWRSGAGCWHARRSP